MKKTELLNSVTRSFHKVGFQLKKHSPEILVVAGVIGTVASAVMACKATTKVSAIVEETKSDLEKIHDGVEKQKKLPDGETYTQEIANKDTAIVYTQTGLKLVKLYGPSVALGALSITSILCSNHILRKRNIALAAAYTTIDRTFKDYRSRVIERFGKELDHELRYNIKAKEVEETVVDENGNETVVTKTINTAEINQHSDYARFFDEFCTGWQRNAELNLYFLKSQQNYANELLKSRGYVFLNEIYDMLGIPKTKAGQAVGWVYDEKCPMGDNYIDFGIYEITNANARDFVNGREKSILLDFNVDGNILDSFWMKTLDNPGSGNWRQNILDCPKSYAI